MSRPRRRRSLPHLRVVAHGVPDRDIAVLWHLADAGEAADRIVGTVMEAISTELASVDLDDAVLDDIEVAIIRGALRGAVVKGLRENLFRRVIAAREP